MSNRPRRHRLKKLNNQVPKPLPIPEITDAGSYEQAATHARYRTDAAYRRSVDEQFASLHEDSTRTRVSDDSVTHTPTPSDKDTD